MQSGIVMKATSSYYSSALVAAALLLATTNASAQASARQAASASRPVTVVTLYSETRSAPNAVFNEDKNKSERPPIQIVDGGVKSAGASCWELSVTGQIAPQAGDCYILRSATPGEKRPDQ